MTTGQANPERAELCSDAIFAVIITVLALKLNPPHPDTFSALPPPDRVPATGHPNPEER
jgi:uncharacterized membrane protein